MWGGVPNCSIYKLVKIYFALPCFIVQLVVEYTHCFWSPMYAALAVFFSVGGSSSLILNLHWHTDIIHSIVLYIVTIY